MAHSYDVGTQAWQPDSTEGWVASEVSKKLVDGDNVTLVFQLANGEVRTQTALDDLLSFSLSVLDGGVFADLSNYPRPKKSKRPRLPFQTIVPHHYHP